MELVRAHSGDGDFAQALDSKEGKVINASVARYDHSLIARCDFFIYLPCK